MILNLTLSTFMPLARSDNLFDFFVAIKNLNFSLEKFVVTDEFLT